MSMLAETRIGVLVAAPLLILMIIIQMTESWPRVSRNLLRWAARRCFATPPLRERFEEEWLADLDEVPGKLTKLAHCLGVLLFTAAPLWARSRWRRSQLARRLDRVTIRPRPTGAVTGGYSGAALALARVGAVALTVAVTGLVTVQVVQSSLRLLHERAAPSAVSGEFRADLGTSMGPFQQASGLNGSGQGAVVEYQQMGWGMQVDTRVVGIPAGTACQVYIISKDGTHHLVGTFVTDTAENNVWYPGGTSFNEPQVKSFEVTTGRTPPVFIRGPAGAGAN